MIGQSEAISTNWNRACNSLIGYRYTFHRDDRWRLRVGGTLFVRDAEIELTQGALARANDDLGLVPLLNFAAEYQASPKWRLVSEIDGAVASQGRAVDLLAKAQYALTDDCRLSLGYRTIEGGADNDEVFTFAWLNQIVAGLEFRF